jgi:hypothetical protein
MWTKLDGCRADRHRPPSPPGSPKRNSAPSWPATGTGSTPPRCAHASTASTRGAPTRGIEEIKRLADTIETWWDGIEAFLRTGITNAKSEGINRAVKLAARNAYGFRNPENQRLRTRSVTSKVTVPG